MPVFGVPRLDDALAGHRRGDATLIMNQPGIEARPFLVQAAEQAAREGRPIVLLVTDRSPHRFLDAMDDAPQELLVLDAHGSMHGHVASDAVPVDPRNLVDVIAHIEQAAKRLPEALFVLDSLDGLERHAGARGLAAQGPRLLDAVGRFADAVVSFTHWTEEVALTPVLDGFANRVSLQAIEERIITSQYFRIDRVRGGPQETTPVLYRSDDGHVRVYVPKVVVTGDADAGKTTFIHTICDRARSAEQMGKTVAMDRGHIDRDGLRVDIFGTPGQERFDPLMAPIMRQAVGVILMVDSTRPDTFPRGRQMLNMAWRHGLHAIIAANKQDVEGAMSADEVAHHIAPPEGVEVVACRADDRDTASHVFDRLLYKILSPRVAA